MELPFPFCVGSEGRSYHLLLCRIGVMELPSPSDGVLWDLLKIKT